MSLPKDKVLVFTATYNECENITALLNGIWESLPSADILVIDDNSPDGTGKILNTISNNNSNLKVHHRPSKLGVGSAHREAFCYARDKGYEKLVTIDADFSHDPKMIKIFVDSLNQYEYVIGSRFTKGGKSDYQGLRRIISFSANLLSRFVLGLSCHETTTSFRGFNKSLLNRLPIDEVSAEGYSFFLECTYIICKTTSNILEIPIHLQDRRFGKSKISRKEIFIGLLTLIRLFFARLGLK